MIFLGLKLQFPKHCQKEKYFKKTSTISRYSGSYILWSKHWFKVGNHWLPDLILEHENKSKYPISIAKSFLLIK